MKSKDYKPSKTNNMKRTIFTFIAVISALTSCQKHEVPFESKILTAKIEEVTQTKTNMDYNNNICWSSGDQVIAFMNSSLGQKYQVTEESVGKTYAHFEVVSEVNGNSLYAGTEWEHNIVYYPYSDDIEAEESGSDYVLNVILPSEQVYALESFGNGAMPMVAVSENNNFTFKNVCGGMKLQLKGTQKVTSIKIEGKDNEIISGAATVTAYTDSETKPEIIMSQNASTSVTLTCNSGVQLNESTATEFIIAIPPVCFSHGFTVTVVDSNNQNYTIQTEKVNEVLRSSLLVMPEISICDSPSEGNEPEEGDYVDEYGINHGQGIEVGGVIWAPVNCGYKAATADSKGFPYGKLYQWGRKYGQGYSEEYDESIPTLEPGGVSKIVGNHKDNENVFYTSTHDLEYNWWCYPSEGILSDPCPDGWRLPSGIELEKLTEMYHIPSDDIGYFFYRLREDLMNQHPDYPDMVEATIEVLWDSFNVQYNERNVNNLPGCYFMDDDCMMLFLPAAGRRWHDGESNFREIDGDYYSSDNFILSFSRGYALPNRRSGSADGYSVRCVRE